MRTLSSILPIKLHALLSACLLLVLLSACGGSGEVEPPPGASAHDGQATADRIATARERFGEHHAKRLAQFIAEAGHRPTGGVVFLGDSLTEGQNIESLLPDGRYVNRGIVGDKIRAVVERLDVSVGALKPAQVFVLVGINEFIWDPVPVPETFESDFSLLIAGLRQEAPGADIIIQSLFPVGGGVPNGAARVVQANGILRRLAA